MQNKKKLSLASIKVKSFVTTLDHNATTKLIGGNGPDVTADPQNCYNSVPGYCLNPLTGDNCTIAGCGTVPTDTGGGGGKTDGQCIDDSGVCSGLPRGCG